MSTAKSLARAPRFVIRQTRKGFRYLRWLAQRNSNESVYFFTFHKCASSLFGGFVLGNIEGLRQVDYAVQIYRGQQVDELVFEKKGYVYGPLRLSADPEGDVYRRLVEPVAREDYLSDKTALFLIRDPRDILVSSYYSFGYTHGISPVAEIGEKQERKRDEIQQMGIDEFVLQAADQTLENFETLERLSKAVPRSVVLRFEDMVDNWDRFRQDLTKYVDLKPSVVEKIWERSRPREKEDQASHQRSGKPGEFHEKLNASTVQSLNRTFGSILDRFGYDD